MPEPISTVKEYFDRLAEAFAGADPAVAQDATYDAQEFLSAEREELEAAGDAAVEEADLVARLRAGFGEPGEVAESYRTTEARVAAALALPRPRRGDSLAAKILGVFTEPHSYGALFFMLLSLPIGIVYFAWAVTGVSLSLGLGILIFGFLFFLFFVSTLRAVALIECRIVETLLGVRMPRRPAAVAPQGTWVERLKYSVTDSRTWLTVLYMIFYLPLAVVYFTVSTVLLTLAFSLLMAPILQAVFAYPIIEFFGASYYLPLWLTPLLWLAAAFNLLLLLHFARVMGRWHARLAKSMLVRRIV